MLFDLKVLLSLVSTLSLASKAIADCSYVGGNYYCAQTDAVVYENLGFSGSYSDVTNMDETSCQCSQQSLSFSGTMSPLDEELSVHFRGPLSLAQFGVYYPAGSSQKKKKVKRDDTTGCDTTQAVHHVHKRAAAVEIVEATATVYEDLQGSTIYPSGVSSAAPAAPAASSASSAAAPASQASSAPAASSSSSSSGAGAGAGDWVRSSYYAPGTGDNLVFLNHQGGTAGSGTWSSCFGNSLSYCASDGQSGAGSAQVLDSVTIASDVEYLIMSGNQCGASSPSGDCGYYREGTPAFHGFSGADKIFVFEFQMPSDTSGSTYNQDMPAIWLLNAKIPRTLQYGDATCSCWSTGCGELDLFEILSSGSDKLISHLHDGQGGNGAQGGGGSQDYFDRPTDSTMKAAAVFTGGDVYIVELDDSTDFSDSLSSGTVNSWISTSASVAQIA
ncbi:DEKNAAC105213 [Brettanomyces naardenensis]|uniref:glucan endo-1,3-beta-D-glucosidase n=1 Tax=Brettanomyces naardenensis TaxID=13370 RepID=A0A448YSX4_BRENA|nr:DEKNAAC105213 [Brettanomyces naardenensis]